MAYDLKKESDVKEYLDKLGVEYRFGCYSEKKPEVCHLLGDYLEGIKKDFEKAAKVYKSTCDDYGYAKSCFKFGNYSFLGKGKSGSKGEPKVAYSYYEKGCNLNDSDSCLHAGLFLVSRALNKDIDRNIPKGFEFLTKSCNMNNATACFYLSGMHISGVVRPTDSDQNSGISMDGKSHDKKSNKESDYLVSKDMKKAFEYAQKACDLRNMYACANLSQMYARGDGVDKNEKLAEKYKKIALDLQEEKKPQNQLDFQQGIKQPQ